MLVVQDEEETTEPPQLSVKREFSLNKVALPPPPLNNREKGIPKDSHHTRLSCLNSLPEKVTFS
jgi:hypothetical protein